ncbi:MAG TPA: hypothetical protein EYP33_00615 [Pyrodictium sp.]|nr:hypothetical protein [Pyrodictium sp.]
MGLLYTASEVGILAGNLAGGAPAGTLDRGKVPMTSLSASALVFASMLLPSRVPAYAGSPRTSSLPGSARQPYTR